MGDAIEFSEERILRFATDGGLSTEQAQSFLDNKCYSLQLMNIPAQVIGMCMEEKAFKGCLLVGVQDGTTPASMNVQVWMPAANAADVMKVIKEAFELLGLENPYELQELEKMDSAMNGRGYITAMLQGAMSEGQDVS